jgi:hypothetical protein
VVTEAVTLADETSHGLRRPETEAVIDTVNPIFAATSILTSLLAPTEVAQPGLPPTPALRTAHDPAPLLVDPAMTAADPGPPGEAAEKKRDAARTTVIATDPIPAVNHHAHVLPDETEADRVPSPAA